MVKKLVIYNFYRNKKVLVTGHTGFKGSWLTAWLLKMGSRVVGVSKDVTTNPSNYKVLNLEKKIKNYFLDIKDFNKIKKIIIKEKPDVIFHLAAQAILSTSYKDPAETINSNTLGSFNILHATSFLKKKCNCIMVTSDKCYFNLEKKSGYKENSILGGKDIYSGSKAAAEIILNSYYHSFLKGKTNISFCTARAGNVIGGGDWSQDRLIPDIIKAWSKKKKTIIKSPNSIRPWQHVLEPLLGYLKLGFYLNKNKKFNGHSFNFGPTQKKSYKVIDLVKKLEKFWKFKKMYIIKKNTKFKETKILRLDSNKALKKLNWKTFFSLSELSFYISEWYVAYYSKEKKMLNLSLNQINNYEKKVFK
jgi:CDP-glucose 4,6-dehydratase